MNKDGIWEMHDRLEAFFFTHKGGVRQNNEDGLLVKNVLVSNLSMERPDSLHSDLEDTIFSIADGIGGEKKGEVASFLTLSYMRDHDTEISDEDSLTIILSKAKFELDDYVTRNPKSFNLGCTASGFLIRQDKIIAFNIGDCRVYRINGRYFERITKDHSIVQNLFEDGIISEDEMRSHPRKNIVTSSISGDNAPNSLKVYTTSLSKRKNDTFFVCSDGIWGCFSQDELEIIYEKYKGYDFCEKLLIAALARRASDNISAILVNLIPIE